VDLVSKGHEFSPGTQYDIVISTECFEHDFFYEKTVENAVRLTKSGGLFLFTCASTGRPEHGTHRSLQPESSPHSCVEWDDYYKNLTELDIRKCMDVEAAFESFEFEYNPVSHDLYFYGIKR